MSQGVGEIFCLPKTAWPPTYVAMVTRVYRQAALGEVSEDEIQDMLKFFSRGGSCTGYFDGCSYGNMMDPVGQTKISQDLPQVVYQEKKVPVTMYFSGISGEAMVLTAISGDETVMVSGDICQVAHSRPTTKERVEEQLSKLGETPFYAEQIEVTLSDDAMIPVSALNALRRQAASELEIAIAGRFRRHPLAPVPETRTAKRVSKELELCVEVMTKEQLEAALSMGIRRIYLPASLAAFAERVPEPVLQREPITKEGKTPELSDFKRVCIQNLGQLTSAKGREITAGHRLNIANSETVRMLSEAGILRAVLSPELNLKAISSLRKYTDMELEVIGYGRLPLMLLENCLIKSNGACGCESGCFSLKDRKNEEFPLIPTRCGNLIYNGKPIYMADRISDIKNLQIDSIRLCFTLENYDKCCIIIREYQDALSGKSVKSSSDDFTRGHFYRGML